MRFSPACRTKSVSIAGRGARELLKVKVYGIAGARFGTMGPWSSSATLDIWERQGQAEGGRYTG